MAEVEFHCINCGRVYFEEVPEDTDFEKLDTEFEHDFDCTDETNFPDYDEED